MSFTNPTTYYTMKALDYEKDMYKYIAENILAKDISPNFVGYIGYGEISSGNLKLLLNLNKM